jgi:hypothetical protein
VRSLSGSQESCEVDTNCCVLAAPFFSGTIANIHIVLGTNMYWTKAELGRCDRSLINSMDKPNSSFRVPSGNTRRRHAPSAEMHRLSSPTLRHLRTGDSTAEGFGQIPSLKARGSDFPRVDDVPRRETLRYDNVQADTKYKQQSAPPTTHPRRHVSPVITTDIRLGATSQATSFLRPNIFLLHQLATGPLLRVLPLAVILLFVLF